MKVNRFWADYSAYDGKGAYLTRNIPVASSNFTEMMFALSGSLMISKTLRIPKP